MTYIPGFENPVGYITGVRQWVYKYGLLNSTVIDRFSWCPHEAPVAVNDVTILGLGGRHPSGYYAAKPGHSELLEYSGKIITGTVALWGEIHEHEKGYRAEYAYPLTFDHCTDRLVNLDELRELYLQPPTEKTRIIAEERKRWILEKRKESIESAQSAFLTQCRQQALALAQPNTKNRSALLQSQQIRGGVVGQYFGRAWWP